MFEQSWTSKRSNEDAETALSSFSHEMIERRIGKGKDLLGWLEGRIEEARSSGFRSPESA
jgi:hypothetical protein